MQPHTRAIVAVSAYALFTGDKVAGLYDRADGRHLQGYDGDRDVNFGGTLPELRDDGDGVPYFHV